MYFSAQHIEWFTSYILHEFAGAKLTNYSILSIIDYIKQQNTMKKYQYDVIERDFLQGKNVRRAMHK